VCVSNHYERLLTKLVLVLTPKVIDGGGSKFFGWFKVRELRKSYSEDFIYIYLFEN